MSYNEAIDKIKSLLKFGSRPGLENISKLLSKMGNPQDNLKYIHLAGTNGKGSTSTMISQVFIDANYKTGLFTSPYIIDFCERIKINDEMIEQKDLTDIVEYIFPIVEQMAKNDEIITEFELITAIAFKYFSDKLCDVVVLETGLGGRLDSTNVINTPIVSVITSLSLDHTAVLGDTIEEICKEKCGIIKENGNTVYFRQEKIVDEIIINDCKNKNNLLYFADDIKVEVLKDDINGSKFLYDEHKVNLKLVGEHQIKNATTALKAIEILKENGFNINIDNIKNGLSKAFLPARFEVLSTTPLIILDGSHNPQGLEFFAKSLKKYAKSKKITCIMGMLKDKDSQTSLTYLKDICNTVLTLTINNERTLTSEQLKSYASNYFEKVISFDDNKSCIEYAINLKNNDAIVICGSLYLASELRPLLLEYLNVEKIN